MLHFLKTFLRGGGSKVLIECFFFFLKKKNYSSRLIAWLAWYIHAVMKNLLYMNERYRQCIVGAYNCIDITYMLILQGMCNICLYRDILLLKCMKVSSTPYHRLHGQTCAVRSWRRSRHTPPPVSHWSLLGYSQISQRETFSGFLYTYSGKWLSEI